MPDNYTQSKSEDALKTLVDALTVKDITTAGGAASSQVFTGIDTDTIALPCVVCMADGQWSEPAGLLGTGNLSGTLTARVKSNANDASPSDATAARQAHLDRVTAVRNGIFMDNLAAQLSAAVTEFYCIGVISFGETRAIQEGKTWVSDLSITGIFAATDL